VPNTEEKPLNINLDQKIIEPIKNSDLDQPKNDQD